MDASVMSSSLDPSNQSDGREGEFIDHVGWSSVEFSVQTIEPRESATRHRDWHLTRYKTWEALKRIATNDKTLTAFANCGSGMWLQVCQADGDMRLSCNKCRNRWCQACGRERAARIVQGTLNVMSGKNPRFLTLTLRHSATPLTDQIDRIYDSFKKLRKRDAWNNHVTGGAAFLEVKLSEKDGLWHVHLHCLIEGEYWDGYEISREWHAVTGDSFIIDIRPVENHEYRARYVTKYVTKPADASVYRSCDKLDELIIAMRGRRLCLTFGSWRGNKLDEAEPDEREFKNVGCVQFLVDAAQYGDSESMRWVEAACRKWPLFRDVWAPWVKIESDGEPQDSS